jgi:hypothetical protein
MSRPGGGEAAAEFQKISIIAALFSPILSGLWRRTCNWAERSSY